MARRYYRFKPATRLRVSVKIALAVAGTTIAGLMIVLIIILSTADRETSYAESPMVFETAEITQDTAAVLRGSLNQIVLGVEIKASGDGTPLKLSSIVFSANGTSVPVTKNIENARLWYTGKDKNFITQQQVGSTILQVTEKTFEMAVNRLLNPGKNYFWLTFDLKTDASTKNGSVDAECISLQIGATSFLSQNSAPAGKKKILNNISYFSTGIPNVYQPAAWNSKRDGSGIEPEKIDDLHNSYFIQSGHKLTNTKETFLSALVIEKNATLKAVQNLKAKNLLIRDGGIYQQEFTITDFNPIENFTMDNGANYLHVNEGKLPGVKKYFSPRSNQCFYQYSNFTFSEKMEWGNVLINTTIGTDMDVSNIFRNVQGDLEIRRTGSNHYLFTGRNDTINIGGSLIFSGGAFNGPSGINTSLTFNVARDLIMKDGMFMDGDGNKNSCTILNISGNVMFLGGVFDFTKCSEGLSQINFTDHKTKTVYWSHKTGNVELGNINILPGKEMIIKNGKIGEIAEGKSLIVHSGAKLMCAQFPVSGKGKFVLKENATLGIGSVKGINSIMREGNILTREKYFDSRANYIFYTGCTPQQTGVFTTSPENGKVKNLTVKKDKPSDYVFLSQDIEVSEQAFITMGQLDKGKNKITLLKISDSVTMGKRN